MGEMRFDGQVAVITGAGGNPGLGRAYARLLAARGAKVVVNDLGVGPDGRNIAPVRAEQVAKEIRSEGGEAIADGHSVASEESAARIVKTALDAWGRLDILINNAGVNIPALFEEITAADIERTVAVHYMGTIWMCRAAWPHMKAAGYGRIVNTSSSTALGLRYLPIYGASKTGVLGLTRALAIEGADHGILVNSISPGAGTASAFYISQSSPQFDAAMKAMTPEKVAPTVAFLAHRDCQVSARHFTAGGDHVAEIFFSETQGVSQPGLTPEAVRDALGAIGDRAHSKVCDNPVEQDQRAPQMFVPKPYVPKT